MTDVEFQQYLEYWKIPQLETYIEKLEEAFGNGISEVIIERNFINVLIRSYPHCILVLKEIICLIKNGYPDGALARARRIYENMIIATYLNTHKVDSDFDKVIERYFDDQCIRVYDGRKKYFRSVNQPNKADNYNKAINKIVKKHTTPKGFNNKKKEILSNNYWWAKNSTMSFSQLSKCFEDDHAKFLYLRACYSIHAGALGDVALLGRPISNELCLYSGGTYNGSATAMLLAVSSFCNLTEIVFENLEISSPVSNEEFIALLQTYLENNGDELKVQKNISE